MSNIICGNCGACSDELVSHGRTASGTKRYRCKVCGKVRVPEIIENVNCDDEHIPPEFEELQNPELDIDTWLDQFQAIQKLRMKAQPSILSATVRFKTGGLPIAFSPTSCWHLGGLYTFYEEFRNKMNELLEIDRFYWGAHGDEYDGFPANWATTVFLNLAPPYLQKRIVSKVIDKLQHNGKLLYSMWSNHPAFEERKTGEDMSEVMYLGKVPYFVGKGIVKLCVDDQEYILSVAHEFPGHSQWNENHAQRKQLMKVPQADFIIMGDKHTYAYQERAHNIEAYDAGLQENMIAHLVQTGTAKSLNDPYSVRNWNRGVFIWPTFVLSAKEHKIHKIYDTEALKWYLDRDDF